MLIVVSPLDNMDLLPKTQREFSSAEYWNSFFKKRGKESFEWYGEYTELCGILHKYIKTKDNTLVIGCGSSRLSEDMYDLGYHSMVNIDISEVVIKQMKTRNATKRPSMVFEKMDVFKMSYDDAQFSVVLDKGTLDALLPNGDEDAIADILKMFEEVGRVLRIGGRYVCISLAQKHIVDTVLKYFPESGWMTRVHCLLKDGFADGGDEFPLPVFAFIFTKFKKLPGSTLILEFAIGEDGTLGRHNSVEDLSKVIEETQNYSLIKHNLHKRLEPGEQIQLELHSPETSRLRFTLTVVDRTSSAQKSNKFAIFIVPQGREVEWMFSTDPGRAHLAESAGFQRLVVVCLQRGQSYGSLDSIQDELSQKVMELAPKGSDKNIKVPFLSIGEDIGNRKVVYEGKSELSGDFVVEDVGSGDGNMYRRLIFLSSKDIVQSEVLLKRETSKNAAGGKKNKKKKKTTQRDTEGAIIIDNSSLSVEHQHGMVASLAIIDDILTKIATKLKLLIIGLGGGNLPMFLHMHFKQVHMDVVELDSAVVDVAKKWFGLQTDDRLKVYTDDGIRFIKELAQQETGNQPFRYDAVIFDVDSKDTTVGMAAPPEAFVELDFLLRVKEILNPSGALIMNLACRNQEKKTEVMGRIKNCFDLVCSTHFEESVNEIVCACSRAPSMDTENVMEKWRTNAFELTNVAEKSRDNDDLDLDLSGCMVDLKIL